MFAMPGVGLMWAKNSPRSAGSAEQPKTPNTEEALTTKKANSRVLFYWRK
jgi:hypothetical protein